MAAMMVSMVCRYQIGVVEKNYGITGTTISDFTNSMQVLARVTEKPYHELKKMSEHTFEMEDATELDQFNKKLENKNAYLLVRKDGTIVYTGNDDDRVKAVIEQLPGYGDTDTTSENGIYLGGDAEALVKQVDFRYDRIEFNDFRSERSSCLLLGSNQSRIVRNLRNCQVHGGNDTRSRIILVRAGGSYQQ